ncbi:MAG: hypothetical protein AWU58_1969 [Methanohalophilus sp. T328-1]|jgi:hypothetical protein|uniref:Uncharacterized protein n=1 Tax=Methanohalophilus euhalobius TaxID=51203 RepID=A0A285GKL9_9EURY|nr:MULTISPECIES: hypothetical protein [Methanohalophilus]KXS40291.1 MAG: hypothetical protein AWU58_1969 [Methanohalophilus sp. T328-1]RSD33289.1 MAG: hypothetical protein CI952_1607 [Methanohalophilus sp.]OBZ34956.1 MAG: hypothetical protein A9957_09250 [Methanohalophilus sp. DAL1]ODV49909.1 MAG: hypothetical protein A8273_568 [Methanohalophilus sp. 2-GBenrich]RSD33374.1 MAG: hypothetical protein CI953_1621 [Methanohalophilus sp.]
MTEVTVNSRICGYKHKINAEKEGKKVKVDITSDCKKIQAMSKMEVPRMEIFDIRDNYITKKAQEAHTCPTCIVPSGAIHACHLESGFISKTLAKESGSVSIDFDEEIDD